MKKVQDTHLNIGGLNWPVLINAEQVCRVMVDLRNNIELGLRCVLDCIKANNRRIKVRKRGLQKGLNVKMQNAGIKEVPAGAERWCSKCSV